MPGTVTDDLVAQGVTEKLRVVRVANLWQRTMLRTLNHTLLAKTSILEEQVPGPTAQIPGTSRRSVHGIRSDRCDGVARMEAGGARARPARILCAVSLLSLGTAWGV